MEKEVKREPYIFPGQLEEMKPFLGKRVKVQCSRTKRFYTGSLSFVGYNELLPSWGLHCTIDRHPGIHLDSVANIQLLENEDTAN